jgi:flagellar assembly factor FliW
MLIQTTRFGAVEIDESRIITFAEGLLGFPDRRRFALMQMNDDPVFFWLQCVDEPGLAFVVCDPLAFVPDYQAPIRAEELELLGMADVSDGQALIIVNKVDGCLTGNLLGPLVIGAHSLKGRQLVLSNRRYSTRHVLRRLDEQAGVVSRSA